MYYCEYCRYVRQWPHSFTASYGRCELCGKTATCHDVPSGELPAARPAAASRVDTNLDTPRMPLKVWKALINSLIDRYGEDAVLETDAGANNVSLYVVVKRQTNHGEGSA